MTLLEKVKDELYPGRDVNTEEKIWSNASSDKIAERYAQELTKAKLIEVREKTAHYDEINSPKILSEENEEKSLSFKQLQKDILNYNAKSEYKHASIIILRDIFSKPSKE